LTALTAPAAPKAAIAAIAATATVSTIATDDTIATDGPVSGLAGLAMGAGVANSRTTAQDSTVITVSLSDRWRGAYRTADRHHQQRDANRCNTHVTRPCRTVCMTYPLESTHKSRRPKGATGRASSRAI
jgi:arylamine N-acetyltransferase